MFHSRHTPETALLKLLAGLAALAVLACASVLAMLGMRAIAYSPLLATAMVLAIGVLLVGLRRLVGEIADRRAAYDLAASELTTLTFPPEPRVQRPRPSQLR
ncbi:MAG TPA: hypothetical protein VFM98_18690 [Ramlibacter sp.]|uniref:hypothetical protein n=1 Tax=Ramlibacter sp. TaxID=1917967 RepID=UPI002D80CADD|nr:hypothetical protein [Ramlibacter sp.]HET8747633.1 hypothetical protein [Ramlibacter sp.]